MSETSRLVRLGWFIVPVGVVLDWAGRLGSHNAHLPFMLDSVGTVFSGAIGGPFIGGCTGLLSWLVLALTGFSHIPIGVGVGIVVMGYVAGWAGRRGWFLDLRGILVAAPVLALITTAIRVPLNILWWDGQSGKTLGDAVLMELSKHHWGLWLPAFLGEFITNVISAAIACLLVYFVHLGIPGWSQDVEGTSSSE